MSAATMDGLDAARGKVRKRLTDLGAVISHPIIHSHFRDTDVWMRWRRRRVAGCHIKLITGQWTCEVCEEEVLQNPPIKQRLTNWLSCGGQTLAGKPGF